MCETPCVCGLQNDGENEGVRLKAVSCNASTLQKERKSKLVSTKQFLIETSVGA